MKDRLIMIVLKGGMQIQENIKNEEVHNICYGLPTLCCKNDLKKKTKYGIIQM